MTFSPMTTLQEKSAGFPDYDQFVARFYEDLWRFAMSLAGNLDDAFDLTQQTFYLLQIRGHQIRDPQKTKGWLFSTLYREYLKKCRREARFPHFEMDQVEEDLPRLTPDNVEKMDAGIVFAAMQKLEDKFRIPLSLFYIEELSYKEIAELLGLPAGTVMSRLSRAKAHIRSLLRMEEKTQLRTDMDAPLNVQLWRACASPTN
jgi:RNA polymerase sigma factor (sigma-70 family)